jgi:hypothetical protein
MTAVTITYFLMQAGERVIGFGVVEVLYVPVDQLKILPVVFRVAGSAFLIFVAVISCSGIDTCGQVFVTIQAFEGVGFFPNSVALGAVFYPGPLSMNLAELARRHQQANILA